MRVIAIATGYYGKQLRRPGDAFEIEDDDAFSDAWMIRSGTPAAAKAVAELKTPPPSGKGSKRKTDHELQEDAIKAEAERKAAAARVAAENEDDGSRDGDAEDDVDDDDKPVDEVNGEELGKAEEAKAPLAIRRRPRT